MGDAQVEQKCHLVRDDWDDPHVSPTPTCAEDMYDPERIRRVVALMVPAIRRQERRDHGPPDAA